MTVWVAVRLHLQVGFPNTGPWSLLALLIPVLLWRLPKVWQADMALSIVGVLLRLHILNVTTKLCFQDENPTCCFDSKRGWWSPRQLCPRAAVVEASRTSTPLQTTSSGRVTRWMEKDQNAGFEPDIRSPMCWCEGIWEELCSVESSPRGVGRPCPGERTLRQLRVSLRVVPDHSNIVTLFLLSRSNKIFVSFFIILYIYIDIWYLRSWWEWACLGSERCEQRGLREQLRLVQMWPNVQMCKFYQTVQMWPNVTNVQMRPNVQMWPNVHIWSNVQLATCQVTGGGCILIYVGALL